MRAGSSGRMSSYATCSMPMMRDRRWHSEWLHLRPITMLRCVRLDEQFDRIGALDTKAASSLGAAAALLPIFGALFAAFNKNPPKASTFVPI
jgi:hypothetical protein